MKRRGWREQGCLREKEKPDQKKDSMGKIVEEEIEQRESKREECCLLSQICSSLAQWERPSATSMRRSEWRCTMREREREREKEGEEARQIMADILEREDRKR